MNASVVPERQRPTPLSESSSRSVVRKGPEDGETFSRSSSSKRFVRHPSPIGASFFSTFDLDLNQEKQMAISAVCILDLRGRLLLARDYRGDVPLAPAAEAFARALAGQGSGGSDPSSSSGPSVTSSGMALPVGAAVDAGESGSLPPVLHRDGVSYASVRHADVLLLAVARANANAASALLFLHRLAAVFEHFFGALEEESLRDNFVVAYELLDECMDHGYPQFTEGAILSEFIKTDAHRLASALAQGGIAGLVAAGAVVAGASASGSGLLPSQVPRGPPAAVTNAVSWRSDGLKYKKNEVFLDVVEKVNLIVSSSGAPVRSEVCGALKMRTYLSGMPECRLGLNDRVLFEAQGRGGAAAGGRGERAGGGGSSGSSQQRAVDLEDVKFHQCVRLARFDADRTISFVPPDGAFDLMTYRLSQHVRPLITVECRVNRVSRSRTEYLVKARSQFKERSSAQGVEISLPLPRDATSPAVRASSGTATHVPERDALVWKIKSFPGGKELLLRAKFSLPSVEADDEVSTSTSNASNAAASRMPPIRVSFEIPYFTVSGIQVRYLKVIEKSGYQALPWVRYVTTAGEYEIRI